MKNIVKFVGIVLATALVAVGLNSCKQDPHKYVVTKGQPVIKYVTTTEASAADSLITGAATEAVICIVGENLTSVKEVYFNDLKAILSSSFITYNTMIVQVPASIPGEVSNKIFFKAENGATVEFPFEVEVPGPTVTGTVCEYVLPGKQGVLIGNYFVDDPNVPLEVVMPDGQNAEIISFTQTQLTYIVPEGSTASGKITVKTIYGSCESSFNFRDKTNILFDWDADAASVTTPMGKANGWQPATAHIGVMPDAEAIDGNYIYFTGDLVAGPGAVWDEGPWSFTFWPGDNWGTVYPNLKDNPEFAAILAANKWDALKLKFEVCIPKASAWAAQGLGIYFTPASYVDGTNQNNAYYADATFPRAWYIPWKDSGSFDTNGEWITVTIPMTEFKYNHEGNAVGSIDESYFDGMSMFLWNGGVQGTDCHAFVAVDNIRVVP